MKPPLALTRSKRITALAYCSADFGFDPSRDWCLLLHLSWVGKSNGDHQCHERTRKNNFIENRCRSTSFLVLKMSTVLGKASRGITMTNKGCFVTHENAEIWNITWLKYHWTEAEVPPRLSSTVFNTELLHKKRQFLVCRASEGWNEIKALKVGLYLFNKARALLMSLRFEVRFPLPTLDIFLGRI